eukprot:2359774-Rhodomonas_salina.4
MIAELFNKGDKHSSRAAIGPAASTREDETIANATEGITISRELLEKHCSRFKGVFLEQCVQPIPSSNFSHDALRLWSTD